MAREVLPGEGSMSEADFPPLSSHYGPNLRCLLALADAVSSDESRHRIWHRAGIFEIRGYPTRYEVSRLGELRVLRPSTREIRFLPVVLPLASSIRRVPADIRLPAFVLEIDLRLIQRRLEQVVSVQLYDRPSRRTDAEPVEP